jgi:hypothetical protein
MFDAVVNVERERRASMDSDETLSYEAPQITDLGSVEDLTLTDNKQLAGTDGIIFQNQALGDIS